MSYSFSITVGSNSISNFRFSIFLYESHNISYVPPFAIKQCCKDDPLSIWCPIWFPIPILEYEIVIIMVTKLLFKLKTLPYNKVAFLMNVLSCSYKHTFIPFQLFDYFTLFMLIKLKFYNSTILLLSYVTCLTNPIVFK